jgi:putative phosphotransacetylase
MKKGSFLIMKKILVETSARHVHVTQQDLEALFGAGHELTVKSWLSQPGQFASEEQVDVVGPKNTLKRVRILGPVRSATQVELSLTDARSIGVTAPVRESGDVAGSGACKLVGPAGEVEVAEGVIAAKRHIHMTPADAEEFGVKDKDVVSVKVDTNGRALVFGDVVVRVSEKFSLAMHIDTDESNAACAVNGTMGELIK